MLMVVYSDADIVAYVCGGVCVTVDVVMVKRRSGYDGAIKQVPAWYDHRGIMHFV